MTFKYIHDRVSLEANLIGRTSVLFVNRSLVVGSCILNIPAWPMQAPDSSVNMPNAVNLQALLISLRGLQVHPP